MTPFPKYRTTTSRRRPDSVVPAARYRSSRARRTCGLRRKTCSHSQHWTPWPATCSLLPSSKCSSAGCRVTLASVPVRRPACGCNVLPSGHGVEQGDGSAVGYGSVLREETVAQQWPKRRGREAVGARQVPREARFSLNKPSEQVRQSARGAGEVEIDCRLAQDDAWGTGQNDVNSHGLRAAGTHRSGFRPLARRRATRGRTGAGPACPVPARPGGTRGPGR